MRPQVNIQVGGPIAFYCGDPHTAHIVVSNPTTEPWTYYVQVYSENMFWSGSWTVTVPAGSSAPRDLFDTAPSTPMSIPYFAQVNLDDANGEVLFSEQIDTIDVVEKVVPDVDVTLTWD